MWPALNVRARVREDVGAVAGKDAALALDVVADALGIVRSIESSVASDVVTKPDTSPVTAANFAVQPLVASRLARDFPGEPLVAEEDASALRANEGRHLLQRITGLLAGRIDDPLSPHQVLDSLDRGGGRISRRFWAVDPIDGTKGLLRGGQYAVALALVVDGVVECGIIGCPRLYLDTGLRHVDTNPGMRRCSSAR